LSLKGAVGDVSTLGFHHDKVGVRRIKESEAGEGHATDVASCRRGVVM
jgi:hypothetical protein